MNDSNPIPKDLLVQMYSVEKISMRLIARDIGRSVGSVHKYIHIYELDINADYRWNKTPEQIAKTVNKTKGKKRSDLTKRRISESHKIHKAGHKKQRKDGYVGLYYPDYQSSNSDGYVMEHVYIIEQSIGRKLNKNEVVHHINHIRNDNRLENLQLMTFKEHARFHMKERRGKANE